MNESKEEAPVILFVDDEAASVKYFQRAVGAIGKVVTAESVEEGKRILDAHADTLCVLISDQRMPGAYGNELLEYAKVRYPQIVRILTTAYAEMEHTVEAVNQGQIYRYIAKPWDIASLRLEVRQALDHALLGKERDSLVREKIQVTGKQIFWNRIAAIHTLCTMLSSSGTVATDVYLGLARSNRESFGEPDWSIRDYADLIEAESERSARFGRRVIATVGALSTSESDPAHLLAECLGELVIEKRLWERGDEQILVHKSPLFAEFLGATFSDDISDRHVNWLACLIWLGNVNQLPFYAADGTTDLICRGGAARVANLPLANWLDNF